MYTYSIETFILLSQKQLKESMDFQNARKEQLITMINKDEEQLDTIRVSLVNKMDECMCCASGHSAAVSLLSLTNQGRNIRLTLQI